jgi:hypothetical protein
MRELVENVGKPLTAGGVSRFGSLFCEVTAVDRVGTRSVTWNLDRDKLTVHHRIATRTGPRISYTIRLDSTILPSRGSRLWFICPDCESRVHALYLPPNRDRLGCRKCCALVYGSQYPGRTKKRLYRKPRINGTPCRVLRVRVDWSIATWSPSRR